jgi:hypothetical protein
MIGTNATCSTTTTKVTGTSITCSSSITELTKV